jgi:hypothetical protein
MRFPEYHYVQDVRSKRTFRAPSSLNRTPKISSVDLVFCNWLLRAEARRLFSP